MTIADAEEIFSYWESSPPTHHMAQTIAAMFGWKPKQRAPAPSDVTAVVADAARVGIGATSEPTPDQATVILDFEAMQERNRAVMRQIAERNRAETAG
ncbi:MAG TPA: hypothetical protein VHW66_18975 [Stellaceae bacterium]|jgi:hypothetical protein|nr:hypothetical protein [Stellaceae bacterium]